MHIQQRDAGAWYDYRNTCGLRPCARPGWYFASDDAGLVGIGQVPSSRYRLGMGVALKMQEGVLYVSDLVIETAHGRPLNALLMARPAGDAGWASSDLVKRLLGLPGGRTPVYQ